MPYIPHTPQDIEAMLRVVGRASLGELFEDIPERLRFQGRYRIPAGMTEPELCAWMQALAERNGDLEHRASFLGAGCYEHFIPVLIDYLTGRSEFWTAYTPYQPEASQGGLQAIFEFQSSICELTGMDAANASMYDGPTAAAEAALLAYAHHRQKRSVLLLSPTLHPDYREVIAAYMKNLGVEIRILPEKEGVTDIEAAAAQCGESVMALIAASPNFYGTVEDGAALSEAAHKCGALLVSVVNPISLGFLASPGSYGADVAVGDGQPLGVPVGYGGPSFGFFAVRGEYLRNMPGRIVGQTLDKDGKRGFVLTLQTREQHIRREKATSNICSNQALMALRGLIYMTCVGKEGLRDVARQCFQKAHYLAREIQRIPGFALCHDAPFFHEFAVRCPADSEKILSRLREFGIYGGVPLSRWFPERTRDLLVAVTECRTRAQMDRMVSLLKENAANES